MSRLRASGKIDHRAFLLLPLPSEFVSTDHSSILFFAMQITFPNFRPIVGARRRSLYLRGRNCRPSVKGPALGKARRPLTPPKDSLVVYRYAHYHMICISSIPVIHSSATPNIAYFLRANSDHHTQCSPLSKSSAKYLPFLKNHHALLQRRCAFV